MNNVTAAAMIEMGHFRQFKFDRFDTALAGFLAISQGADNAGNEDFPIVHEVLDLVVIVDERNGEAAMRSLRQAGLPVSYEQVWRPLDEVWIAIPNVEESAFDYEAAY